MEARSPFSARFEPIEISCSQISPFWSPQPERVTVRPWRATRSCTASGHAPAAWNCPRSRIRLTPWLRRISRAASALKASEPWSWKLDLLGAKCPRNPTRSTRLGTKTQQQRRYTWHAKPAQALGHVFRARALWLAARKVCFFGHHTFDLF